jgi:hypothetical protein
LPDGTRKVKPSGCDFSDVGIYQALDKAWKIRSALDTITGETELWEWYDREIIGKNVLVNDVITYREIFEQIETKYWSSRNKNTKRKRSKDLANDITTFDDYYMVVFKKFPDWDKSPKWDDLQSALFSWEQGTKKFSDAYSVIKKIINYCPNKDKLLALIADIDGIQTIFRDKQSISLDDFLNWHQQTLDNASPGHRETRESWLWVCSMCVVYGLRPSEVAAALNLTKPYAKNGKTIKALNDPTNTDLLLVLGDFTYFGTSIKTGGRVCKPLVVDSGIIERLRIRYPKLPACGKEASTSKQALLRFPNTFRNNLKDWKCPVTQIYAFRHLSNQLGELYGIPQEIRARSLGHSTAVNDSTYKDRDNFSTSVDILTKHSKQPLSLPMALDRLKALGIDTTDPSVKLILNVIYQIE